jgi:hypothetical protein
VAVSKTRLFQWIRSLNLDAVASILGAHPELKDVKDQRGRNALHVLCSLESNERRKDQSLKLAKYLSGLASTSMPRLHRRGISGHFPLVCHIAGTEHPAGEAAPGVRIDAGILLVGGRLQ